MIAVFRENGDVESYPIPPLTKWFHLFKAPIADYAPAIALLRKNKFFVCGFGNNKNCYNRGFGKIFAMRSEW